MKKTFKVVMLPTEKASSIHLNPKKLVKWHMDITPTNKDCVNQHLYILSDDEIKEGDWCIREYYPPTKGFTRIVEQFIRSKADFGDSLSRKKIVATTDKSLIIKYNDEVLQYMNNPSLVERTIPQLPDSFIQAYIKAYNEGKPITEVDLEMEEIIYPFAQIRPEVKPIRYYQIKTRPDNTVIVHQSKMYSRDEVEKLLSLFADTFINRDEEVDKWIQDNLS